MEYQKLVENNPYFQVQNTDFLVSKFKISQNIDVSKTYLVEQYENIKGAINIEHRIDKKAFKNLMYSTREKHIAYALNKSNHKKIVAIYGSAHIKSLINILKSEYKWES